MGLLGRGIFQRAAETEVLSGSRGEMDAVRGADTAKCSSKYLRQNSNKAMMQRSERET